MNHKLPKAERDLLRYAFLQHNRPNSGNSLAVDSRQTKGNAKLRAHVEHLRELGLVRGVQLTEAGLAAGSAEHEAVEARRRQWRNENP